MKHWYRRGRSRLPDFGNILRDKASRKPVPGGSPTYINLHRVHGTRTYLNTQVRKAFAHGVMVLNGLIIPTQRVSEGVLINSTSHVWGQVIRMLRRDWMRAYEVPAEKWEELVAGAYKEMGFDEVILTPRSGDRGRDVIAIQKGVGCIKIIGSVKAYKPGHLVSYDDIRALLGVLGGERDASKGIITTTSDFPPRVREDPFIAPFLPTRLELMNGDQLQRWLAELVEARR